MMCTCDQGYDSDTCISKNKLPVYLKEGFPLADGLDDDLEVLPVLDSFVSCKWKQ